MPSPDAPPTMTIERLRMLSPADRRAVLRHLPADKRRKAESLLRARQPLRAERRGPVSAAANDVRNDPVREYSPWLADRIAATGEEKGKGYAMTPATRQTLAEIVRAASPVPDTPARRAGPSLFDRGIGLIRRREAGR